MYFTAFSAELIGQPEIQRGQDPEETSTGNQNEQEYTDNQNDQDSVSSESAESVKQPNSSTKNCHRSTENIKLFHPRSLID